MSEWQLMATAPTNGKPILGYAYGRFTTIYWQWFNKNLHQPSAPPSGYWRLCEPGEGNKDDEWTPVYWHPIPEVPYDVPAFTDKDRQ